MAGGFVWFSWVAGESEHGPTADSALGWVGGRDRTETLGVGRGKCQERKEDQVGGRWETQEESRRKAHLGLILKRKQRNEL